MPPVLTFYHYAKCQTCVKARRFLEANRHALNAIDITTSPPSAEELANLIQKSGLGLPDFLNRSGIQYREKNMKELVKKLSRQEILKILSGDGRLIKRPIVTDGKRVTVGFQEETFKKVWGN